MAADEKFVKAKEVQDTYNSLLKDLKENPLQLLLQFHEEEAFDKILEPYMNHRIEWASKTEAEQKQILETIRLKRENMNFKQKEEESKKAEKAKNVENTRAKLLILAKNSGLPENDLIVNRIAQVYQEKKKLGEPVSIQDAVQLVKKEREESAVSLGKTLSSDEIAKQYPDLVAKLKAELEQKMLEETKAAIPTSTVKPERSEPKERKSRKQKSESFEDVYENINRKYNR